MTERPRHRGLRTLIRLIGFAFLRSFYRIRPVDSERLPATGGALLVCNHVSYIDALVVMAACPREVRFVILDYYLSVRWLSPVLRLFGVIPVSQSRPREAVRRVAAALAEGGVVCVFPEGQLSRTGCLNEIRRGFELMIRQSRAPVVPIYLDSLWGSIFSFERGRFVTKIPRRLPYRVQVRFGEPMAAGAADAGTVRSRLNALSAEALADRPELADPLALAIARRLHRHAHRPALVERAGRRRVIRRAGVHAVVSALAHRWDRTLPPGRIGVVLPNSSAAALVHLGLIFAGRIPVAVPFASALNPGLLPALGRAGVGAVIVPRRLRDQLAGSGPAAPSVELLEMGEEIRVAADDHLMRRSLAVRLRPSSRARCAATLRDPAAETAAWLVPDGGAGGFRVVSASGRQLLANALQLDSTNLHRSGDVLLAGLDLATPAGFVLSLLLPLWRFVPVVFPPNSATPDDLARIAESERATWLVGGEPALAMADAARAAAGRPGAPHLALRLATAPNPGGDLLAAAPRIETALGCPLCPCGVDEATGVIHSIGMPPPLARTATARPQDGTRNGTSGRLLPGFAVDESGTRVSGPATADHPVRLPGPPDEEGFVPLP